MILNISGRTDLCAFYSEWLMQRFKEGYVDVRNPFQPHSISRIYLNERNIDGIVFCTKNPIPMLKHLDQIPFPYLFHVTLTPYHKDIEPFVKDKHEIVKAMQQISKKIGKEKVILRYDPIFINDTYTISYHIKAFTSLCEQLEDTIQTFVISFVDLYKNTRKHKKQANINEMKETEIRELCLAFSNIAGQHKIQIQTCAEAMDLRMYNIENKPCFDPVQLQTLFQRQIRGKLHQGVRNNCACMETVDIGDYNCCQHLCKYCYANYDETQIQTRCQQHDPLSSVLIGTIGKEDSIHIREEKSIQQIQLL